MATKTAVIQIRTTPETREKLAALAAGDGRTITNYIERIIEQRYQDSTRSTDAAEIGVYLTRQEVDEILSALPDGALMQKFQRLRDAIGDNCYIL